MISVYDNHDSHVTERGVEIFLDCLQIACIAIIENMALRARSKKHMNYGDLIISVFIA